MSEVVRPIAADAGEPPGAAAGGLPLFLDDLLENERARFVEPAAALA